MSNTIWINYGGALIQVEKTSLDARAAWKERSGAALRLHAYGSSMRKGQWLFQLLYKFDRTDITSVIIAAYPECDPFNDDERIPAFLELVDELWEKEQPEVYITQTAE